MRAAALLVAAVLVGCGAVEPYATLPSGVQPGQPAGARVAICYDTLASSPAEVATAAQRECPGGTRATPVETDWYLQYCPVLLPARATFVCTAAK